MQAAKRYVLVAILSVLLILGYLYIPEETRVSLGSELSRDQSPETTTRNDGALWNRMGEPNREAFAGAQSSLGSKYKLQTQPEETNTQIAADKQSKPIEQQQLDSNPQKKQPSNPQSATNLEVNQETKKPDSAGDSEEITANKEGRPIEGGLKYDGHDEVATDVVPHLKQLMIDTGLKLKQLDTLYNISRVTHVDLHNVTFLDNYYRYNYQIIEERLAKRMKNVRTVCEQINFKRSTQYNLYQFNDIGITWCPVFKSGSTTWRNYFIDKYVPNPPEEYILNLLKPHQLPGSTKRRIEDMKQHFRDENEENIRFTIVRHPYSRLVSHVKSSGRDHEMVNQRGLWIESSIVSSRAHLAANNADLFRYKSEFISYFNWLKSGKPGEVFKDGSPDNPFLNPPYPKLSELVNHIIKMRRSGRDWDGHWMPAHEFCNLCVNKLDYIIRLEDEPLELWYLAEKLGLWADRTLFLNRANNSTKKETELGEVWEEIKKLKKEHVDYLSRHFDVDFKMFGYRRDRGDS